ncbi:hypothetical protein ACQEXU_17175 [Vibrio sp. TRT 21S02]|uniref:hypothetical protein n=1 Tax=Vibrio sp. TRT 21S02 TaxID=3418507 RepID=UPI003CE6BBCB
MKYLTSLIIVILFAIPLSVSANQNAGKVFGAGVQCSFDSGKTQVMPRELCKLHGGKHK